MESRTLLAIISLLATMLHFTGAETCGPKECTNIGQSCGKNRVCVDGYCRRCFCDDPSQCYNMGHGIVGCNCSSTALEGQYCSCPACETCDDIFGFSKPCKRYSADFTCRNFKIEWGSVVEKMHSSKDLSSCKGLCLMEGGCKIFSWTESPSPGTCYWYEPEGLIQNRIEVLPDETTWQTCFRKCEFC